MRNYLLPLLILLCTAAYGQNNDSLSVCKDTLSATKGQTSADSDSVAMGKNLLSDSMIEKRGLDKIAQSRLFQMTYIGVPLIAGGLIEMHEDKKFRSLRNDFLPQFHSEVDNYTQYLPAAILIGLKTSGVKSRSSWGRMLVSDAIAMALVTGTIQGLKHTTTVTRPDGSNMASFPSGHTATAFMTATMLNKEYGHYSPWVGISAYGVATATGLMRMANNKHWLSDVLVGAGIGIISTELGYWIADKIFKDKGLNITESKHGYGAAHNVKPSFLGLYMGFNLPLSKYDLDENNEFETSTGTTIGIEGAYFINRYIGFGGRASISNLHFIINESKTDDNTFHYYSFYVGPYFSLPLSNRWAVGSKLLLGELLYRHPPFTNKNLRTNRSIAYGTGISIDYIIRAKLMGCIFLDYSLHPPHNANSHEYFHAMTLGAKIAVRF